jgi:hypothetical protein
MKMSRADDSGKSGEILGWVKDQLMRPNQLTKHILG